MEDIDMYVSQGQYCDCSGATKVPPPVTGLVVVNISVGVGSLGL